MPVVSTEPPPRWTRGVALTQALSLRERGIEDEPENQEEETMMEHESNVAEEGLPPVQPQQETKVCIRCKQEKPLNRFIRKMKESEDRRPHCADCEREYQRKYSRRKREKLAALEKTLHEVRLIEEHAKAGARCVSPPQNGMQAEPAPAKEISAPTCLQDEDDILENQLLLDFSCYPEVLKEIKRLAHHLERPPEVQARYMLKHLMLDLGGRRPGDIEPMILAYEAQEPLLFGDWPPSDNGDRQ
jgi:hypothetical protein